MNVIASRTILISCGLMALGDLSAAHDEVGIAVVADSCPNQEGNCHLHIHQSQPFFRFMATKIPMPAPMASAKKCLPTKLMIPPQRGMPADLRFEGQPDALVLSCEQ